MAQFVNMRPTMKRQHPLAGILLLIAAVFVAYSPSCGIIGQGIHRATVFLFGHTGLLLLVMGLVVSGLTMTGLAGLLWRLVVAAWKARRSQPQLVRPAPQPRAVTPKTFHVVLQAAPALPPPIVVPPAPPVAKPDPRADDMNTVRSGLKFLGYKPPEIESALQHIDTTASIEAMLRAGIAVLRKKAA